MSYGHGFGTPRRRDAARDGRCEEDRNYRGLSDIGEDLRCSKTALAGTRYCKVHGGANVREAQAAILGALGLAIIS